MQIFLYWSLPSLQVSFLHQRGIAQSGGALSVSKGMMLHSCSSNLQVESTHHGSCWAAFLTFVSLSLSLSQHVHPCPLAMFMIIAGPEGENSPPSGTCGAHHGPVAHSSSDEARESEGWSLLAHLYWSGTPRNRHGKLRGVISVDLEPPKNLPSHLPSCPSSMPHKDSSPMAPEIVSNTRAGVCHPNMEKKIPLSTGEPTSVAGASNDMRPQKANVWNGAKEQLLGGLHTQIKKAALAC